MNGQVVNIEEPQGMKYIIFISKTVKARLGLRLFLNQHCTYSNKESYKVCHILKDTSKNINNCIW